MHGDGVGAAVGAVVGTWVGAVVGAAVVGGAIVGAAVEATGDGVTAPSVKFMFESHMTTHAAAHGTAFAESPSPQTETHACM